MKALYVEWEGCIKFSRSIMTNDCNYIIMYLVQHFNERGKKSHFTIKQFVELDIDPYPKDTIIEFKGYAVENNYKDKKGQYQTKGLEIVATQIKAKEGN